MSVLQLLKSFLYHIQTIEVAKAYYSCDDIEGILLENEGGSGTLRYMPTDIESVYCISSYNLLYYML